MGDVGKRSATSSSPGQPRDISYVVTARMLYLQHWYDLYEPACSIGDGHYTACCKTAHTRRSHKLDNDDVSQLRSGAVQSWYSRSLLLRDRQKTLADRGRRVSSVRHYTEQVPTDIFTPSF